MKAPDFALTDQSGSTVQLSSFLGSWVAILFYPEDNSPYCTKELSGFRDQYEAYIQESIKLVAISNQSPKSHADFSRDCSLPFPLLSDTNGETAKAYGAWGLDPFDQTRIGVLRFSFIIDPQGKIAKQYTNVDVVSHATELLACIRKMKPTQN